MTRYVADADETTCLICRQPLVATFHETSSFGQGRTAYALKFDLQKTATADLERAIREVQARQHELTEEYTRLAVLVEKAQALSHAYDEFRYEASAETIGALVEAARHVVGAAERLDLITANNDDDDNVEDEYLGENDDDGIHDADDEAEIDQQGSFGY